MITMLMAYGVLALAWPDIYDEPLKLDVGPPPPCTDDTDCFTDSPLCDVETGECVQCLGPEHCPEGWTCGPTGYCRDACEVAADCEGVDGQVLCHPETGLCVQCIGPDDCAPEQYCTADGFCRLDFCDPGQTFCAGATIMQCLEDGGTGMEVEVCPEACAVEDGVAQCVAAGGSSGGGTDTGGSVAGGSDAAGTAAGDDTGVTSNGPGGTGGTAVDDEAGGGGCACRAGAPAGAWGWWMALGLGAVVRRRRARPSRAR